MKTLLVNIGKAVPGKRDPLYNVDIHFALERAGFRVEHAAIADSETEETFVGLLTTHRDDDSDRTLALESVCRELGQDCIAVLPMDGTGGELVGPRAADWGKFNPQYFIGL